MAVTPEVQEILDNIDAIQNNFEQPSCALSPDPMVKYPDTGSGKVPILNFNIPQATVFNTYGKMAVPMSEEAISPNEPGLLTYFKEFTKLAPENNYWDIVDKMNAEQVFQFINPYVAEPPSGLLGFSTADGRTFYRDAAARPVTNAADILDRRMKKFSSTATDIVATTDSGVTIIGHPVPEAAKKSRVTDLAAMGYRPVMINRISGRGHAVRYVTKPPKPNPQLFVVEEYTTGAYLGDYGAGRVVKTFSLLPGERTTISVRTYKDMESVRESSKNMLDSFSESSANELDTLIQHEEGNMESSSNSSSDSSSNFSSQSDAKNSQKSFNVSANLSFAGFGASGGYGMSKSTASSSSSGFNSAQAHSSTGARQSNVNSLNNALSKHVQQSNANRQINVNTSTMDTARSGEEDSTVRYLENYNKSRVLNFTFRQLLQEYITITSLTNLKFVYTNGYPESFTIVDLNNLDNMLVDIIKDYVPTGPGDSKTKEFYRDKFRCLMLRPYCSVLNYKGEMKEFLSRKKVTQTCLDPDGTRFEGWDFDSRCGLPQDEYFWRMIPGLSEVYDPNSPGHVGMNLEIPGVILSVKKQTLQTSSVIADALLGRGEALDCFNQKAQAAENTADFIANVSAMQRVDANIDAQVDNKLMNAKLIDKMDKENLALDQQMQIVTDSGTSGGGTPAEQVTAYKKVFGSCCPTPQYTGGCGCGKCAE